MATGKMEMVATASYAPVSTFAQFFSLESFKFPYSATVVAKSPSSRKFCTHALRHKSRGLGFQGRNASCEFVGAEFNSELLSSHWSNRYISCNSSITRIAALRQGHFAEPIVTVGEVEKHEKQLTEEEAVTEYLESVGIDPSSFDELYLQLQLPASLDIVRERVMFLQKIGLTVEDINDYPIMLGYSVKRNFIPVLTYLESLGVTSNSLPILVRKYPQILHTSVVIDLQPHVEYLEGLGIQRADIGSVLTHYPEIFGFKIEGTISTSTAYLVMLGVNPRKMGSILTEMPQILGMRVGNNIKRKVDFLKRFGLTSSDIAKMIETRPQFLGLSLEDQMQPVLNNLVEIGVTQDTVGRVIMQFPDILGLDVKLKLAERLTWLTSEVGISADSLGEVIAKLPQILIINTTKANERVEFLRQAGFSSDVGSMVTNCPQLLAASIDKSLEPNLAYLVGKMRRKLEEVVEFPAYLLYNLEETIQPRHEEITKRSMECSLAWMLNCTDDVFQQRITLEYAEQSTQDEEPDIPYVVARRAKLTDETSVQLPVDSSEDAKNKKSPGWDH
ncbi:transcription termination factor MTERF4, chloroplastic [Physcomitrium patens]|uniref:Uncharacterized protein n=1 Tax=Physcomitrium patens TaxID=3218 RepID=A0A7I3ZNN1_PHYPA|nr:transcription termination factor MTERF4, chloroplastic-like [Physcomitrium patens]|eukprot:XP_024378045.1 transcription termination factor MTERF4, chloroplastic-like [Physcomitrella patens]